MATIAQELGRHFDATDIKDCTPGGINMVEVVSQEDAYSAEKIDSARAIATAHGWKLTVARRGRWLSLEGPITKPVKYDGDMNELMSR